MRFWLKYVLRATKCCKKNALHIFGNVKKRQSSLNPSKVVLPIKMPPQLSFLMKCNRNIRNFFNCLSLAHRFRIKTSNDRVSWLSNNRPYWCMGYCLAMIYSGFRLGHHSSAMIFNHIRRFVSAYLRSVRGIEKWMWYFFGFVIPIYCLNSSGVNLIAKCNWKNIVKLMFVICIISKLNCHNSIVSVSLILSTK